MSKASEFDTGFLEEIGYGLGRLNCAGVGGSGTADPEEVIELHAIPTERDIQSLHPVFAIRGGLAPGMTGGGDLTQHGGGGPAQLALGNEVSARIDDEIDVTNENRAGFDAGVAGCACPERFRIDGFGDFTAIHHGAADTLNYLLWIKDLAYVVGGAHFGAATTLHAGIQRHEVPPAVVLGQFDADLFGLLDFFHRDGLELAHWLVCFSSGGEDRHGDVANPHPREDGKEDEDPDHVEPPHELIETHRNRSLELGEGVADHGGLVPGLGVNANSGGF